MSERESDTIDIVEARARIRVRTLRAVLERIIRSKDFARTTGMFIAVLSVCNFFDFKVCIAFSTSRLRAVISFSSGINVFVVSTYPFVDNSSRISIATFDSSLFGSSTSSHHTRSSGIRVSATFVRFRFRVDRLLTSSVIFSL